MHPKGSCITYSNDFQSTYTQDCFVSLPVVSHVSAMRGLSLVAISLCIKRFLSWAPILPMVETISFFSDWIIIHSKLSAQAGKFQFA